MSDSHVYVQCKKHHWVPARIVEKRKDTAIVSVPQYRDEQSILSDGGKGALKYVRKTVRLSSYANSVLPLQNVDEMGWLDEEMDMVNLPFLHEAAILYNLKSRHIRGKPYTRTGDIVIAVNPYEWFDHLYSPEERQRYAQQLLWNAKPGKDTRLTIEPHVYETSTLAYKGLAEGTNQSILVSGESGAGKTETVKICMNHIAMIQNGPSCKVDEVSAVVKRIVDSNPLLESFGNAKTRRNDNSSRFGKYLQLQFHTGDTADQTQFGGDRPWESCTLVGSKCEVYLLEKSRVINHDKEERNFHIFYQLLASPDSTKKSFWSGLEGKTADSFRYVGANVTNLIEGMTDEEHFQNTVEALSIVGIKGAKLDALMQAIATVLQLGNITFNGCVDKSSIKNTTDLNMLADLVGVPASVVKTALTKRTMAARGETVQVDLGVEVAAESRDALAKAIYEEAFKWLVQEINNATASESVEASGQKSIGLLDIFGFESFQKNGFEQLCINYANEKLQQKFTQDIFRQVQAEYEYEGLALDDIRYEDNHNLLYMVESRMGLLAMLNEECVRPGGCDKEFVYKAIQQNKSSPALIADKRFGPLEFGIHHYAGDVIYTAGSFVAKNNDSLLENLMLCSGQSSNPIIRNVALQNESVSTAVKPGKRKNSAVVAATVWSKYKTGLANLMTELHQTNSRYIRCIKPNEMKKPSIMQHGPTLDQLRSAGVIAAVTITRSAFPNRLEHGVVIDRFRHLSKVGKISGDCFDLGGEVERLLTPLLTPLEVDNNDKTSKAFAVGKTRTYFRAGTLEFLESERVKGYDPAAATLQKVARGFLVRKRKHNSYIVHRDAACKIQKTARVFLSIRRVRNLRERLMNSKETAEAATKINALVRGTIRRMRFRSEIKHYREVTAMKSELEMLQQNVVESERKKVEDVKSAEERVRAALAMIKEDKSTESSASAEALETERLMKARNEEVEKLRSDNKRIRANIKLLEGKYKRLREELRKKKEENENTTKDFLQMNEDAKAMNENNTKSVKNQAIWKKQILALVDEMKRVQASFGEVSNTRVQYQNVMADILKMLRTRCKQEQLIEDTIFIALDSDTEVKAVRASFDAVQAHLADKGKGAKVPSAVGGSQHETSSTESETDDGAVSDIDASTHSARDAEEAELAREEAEMEAEFQALEAEVAGM